jgi:hypothetical protein
MTKRHYNDDDPVAWTFKGQHTMTTAGTLPEMLRAKRAEWGMSDEEIEQEVISKLVPKGRA